MNKNDKNILKRYQQGKCSKAEYLQVKHLFRKDDSSELENKLNEEWNELKADQSLNQRMSNLLIELNEKTRTKTVSLVQSILISYQRIAAVLLIPILIASFWFFNQPEEQVQVATSTLVSPMGGRIQFTLPDGSTGWLNNGSSLSYKTNFRDREVDLIGEAYFDVTHRNRENFTVNTADISVEVLGTKFNVSAYSDDIETSVVLNEGSVKLRNDKGTISEVLKPNEKFDLNKKLHQGSVLQVNSADFIAWKDGYLKFRGEPLSAVLKKMERWYNIEVELNDDQLLGYKYRGTFQNERLEEVLRLISLTSPLKYQIIERKTDKNGNRIERYSAYSTDTLKLISTHKFNDKNQILENDYPTKLENFEYDKNGLIFKKTIKDRNGITILNFYYKNSLPEKIVKLKGKKETTFRYEYEYY